MPEKSDETVAYMLPRWFSVGVDTREEVVRALDVHAGLVIASAARVLGNLADAEDVAQDIAEKLLKSPPGGIRSWPAYLKTLAVNRAVDQLRRRRDWECLDSLDHTDNGASLAGDPEAVVLAEQRANILRRAIANLPERDARIFALHYLGDLAHTEIAAQMDMTTNAVGVALHRLRARLATEVYTALDSTQETQ